MGTNLARIFLSFIMPFLLLGAIVWAIWLGFQMANADNEGKRKQAKQRLFMGVSGVMLIVVLFSILAAIAFFPDPERGVAANQPRVSLMNPVQFPRNHSLERYNRTNTIPAIFHNNDAGNNHWPVFPSGPSIDVMPVATGTLYCMGGSFNVITPTIVASAAGEVRRVQRRYNNTFNNGHRANEWRHVRDGHSGVGETTPGGINRPPGPLQYWAPVTRNGNYVQIRHRFYSEDRTRFIDLYIWYVHLHTVFNQIQVGTQVTAGQSLGTMGSTGFSDLVHLHFQVYQGRGALGPAPVPVSRFFSLISLGNPRPGRTEPQEGVTPSPAMFAANPHIELLDGICQGFGCRGCPPEIGNCTHRATPAAPAT